MLTQDAIIDTIVTKLSPIKYIDKVLFSAHYLVSATPYSITLIIYERCRPNYIATQLEYSKLLKELSNTIELNILAVNCEEATLFLNRRLHNFLTIYQKKPSED